MRLPHYSIARLFLTGMVTVAILTSVVVWSIWIIDHKQQFERESQAIRQNYIDEHKALIKREIDATIDFVRFSRDQTENRIRTSIKNRVAEAHSIATQLYGSYRGKLPDEEIWTLIKEALRPIRFNHGRGYYFAANFNGTMELLADRPEMEGRALINLQDIHGKTITRDMIELARTQESGFYDYYWTKPNYPEQHFPKLSYIKHFEPANWYIGTGEYLDDMEADIKREVLKRITNLTFGKDGYIFVLDYDSQMLAHRANPALVGKKMAEMESERLRILFADMMRVSQEQGSGSITYVWPKKGGGESTKVTYVSRMPEWGWLLGAGFHLDDVDALIEERNAHLRSDLVSHIMAVTLALLLMIIVVLIVASWLSRRIQRNIHIFNDFFDQAVAGSGKIPASEVVFKEFDSLARAANRMVDERKNAEREKETLEQQLIQRQKSEALGTLAGGIAHDFNNLLSAIFGNLDLLRIKLAKGDPNHKYVDGLQHAAIHAKELVQQIVTFSRQSEGKRDPFEFGHTLRESLKLLRASIPTNIDIVTHIADETFWIYADRTQIHQVAMNLCTNAYQELGDRNDGRITVSLQRVGSGQCFQANRDDQLHEQGCVALTIRDNGPGISDEVREHIFDPFFSTKEVGQGTGLGLAVAHRIVTDHGGAIHEEGRLGEGAMFVVCLPLISSPIIEAVPEAPISVNSSHGTRVLLIDDEEAVLDIHSDLFEHLGCTVDGFTDPLDAIEHFRHHSDDYDLIFSDQTMPVLSGAELARLVKGRRADIKVILCSGYNKTLGVEAEIGKTIDAYITKPVTIDQLSNILKQVLNHTS